MEHPGGLHKRGTLRLARGGGGVKRTNGAQAIARSCGVGVWRAILPPPPFPPMPSKEPSVKKSELVAAAAKRLDLSKARAGEIVDAFFGADGIVAGELRKGNTVQISGFGSFEPRQRGARNGRDPKTGKSISIRASVVPAFRPGSALKALVNRRK